MVIMRHVPSLLRSSQRLYLWKAKKKGFSGHGTRKNKTAFQEQAPVQHRFQLNRLISEVRTEEASCSIRSSVTPSDARTLWPADSF